ncbi:HK97 family phage prohead protease [Robiginitomaculum antarcticum]|uniref:HK97 family phage prohead protease n=1 Tax=Robiginitomaculum antarcticum TaxID=437507 RepID=UPI000380F634|nr:HK97 family phage prohead protease [Robiginitomaculum antarcticum]
MSRPSDELRISGYASLFGAVDLSGDIVHRGAFSASLLAQTGRKLPMLLGHETERPIGVWDRVFEDASGLFVSGRIIGGEARTDRARRLIETGALSGLSIGFKTLRSIPNAKGRALIDLDLWEVSIVAFPMLRGARITQIGAPSLITQTSPQQGVLT